MKAIYPGTFDPFSLGHWDLISRAAVLYDEVIVAVSENKRKNPMFSFEDRIHMSRLGTKGIKNATVVGFDGLLVDFMKKNEIKHIIRGIRGMIDFEYEFQMAQANRTLLSGYESIFLMPSEKYMVLNSTFIREIAALGGDVSEFLPSEVNSYLKSLLGQKNE